MKNDFLIAITQLSAEKNLPPDVVMEAVEVALASAYKKENFDPTQEVSVKINPGSGDVEVFLHRNIVEKVEDPLLEISLADAKKLESSAEIGGVVDEESTPPNAGRIAAQTAKQVVLQKLREAEREVVFEEYVDKEGDIVSGVVQRVEPRHVVIDLGKTEAILPSSEQPPNEFYRLGQRLKAFLVEVNRTSRGPQVVVSRTHRSLLRRLFGLEVPEIYNGLVEIKSIAREPGARSKVAVVAKQEGIDPVGSCVGMRGIRIQNIVNELGGEKIDVVQWAEEMPTFVANALSPSQVLQVEVNKEENTARVVVPDRQLSLAIGKDGQNARLAAKLTGLRIDIRSSTVAEAERDEMAERAAASATKTAEADAVKEDAPAAAIAAEPKGLTDGKDAAPVEVAAEAVTAEPDVVEEAAGVAELVDATPAAVEGAEVDEEKVMPDPIPVLEPVAAGEAPGKKGIRFAEEITDGPPRKGRRTRKNEEVELETAKPKVKGAKRAQRLAMEEDDYDDIRY